MWPDIHPRRRRPSRVPPWLRVLAAALWLGVIPTSAAWAGDPDAFQTSYDKERIGDVRGALDALQAVSPKTQRTYVYLLRSAWLLHLAGEHTRSVEAYQKAIAAAPQAVEPRLGLTLPLLSLRRWEDALKASDDVLGKDPRNYLARSRRAFSLYNLGRFDKAEAAYADVLRDYPADVEMRVGLAWSLLKQGKTEQARAEVEAVLEVAPRHPSAQEAQQLLGGG